MSSTGRSGTSEAETLERKHAVTQDMIAAGELPDDVDARRTLDKSLDAWLADPAGAVRELTAAVLTRTA
jgi:hypothetical protein